MQTSPEITVETCILKNRLTEAYTTLRAHGQSMSCVRHFQNLWDLKEQALVEQRDHVQVPSVWLRQVEQAVGTVTH